MRKYKSANSKRSLNSNQDKHSNIILRYIITILLKINDKDKTIRVAGKESACNARDLGSIPGLRRSCGEGKGYPLQYSGLEKPMDCKVHGVAKSRTQLSGSLSLHTIETQHSLSLPEIQIFTQLNLTEHVHYVRVTILNIWGYMSE